jgi:hypothetical protein
MDDRFLRIWGRLTAEEGALVDKALQRLAEQAKPDPVTGIYQPFEERMADALVELAGAKLNADSDADRASVIVHVSAEDLVSMDGVAVLEDGRQLAADTIRRLTCDARLQYVAEDKDGELGRGRMKRTVSRFLMRHLRRRDKGCVFPGCERTRWVEAHHIRHWADGGPTEQENLSLFLPGPPRAFPRGRLAPARLPDGGPEVRESERSDHRRQAATAPRRDPRASQEADEPAARPCTRYVLSDREICCPLLASRRMRSGSSNSTWRSSPEGGVPKRPPMRNTHLTVGARTPRSSSLM